MRASFRFLSWQHDIPQNLPIAVGLALPHGEKAPAIDRQFAVFDQSDLPIPRFIGEITVDDDFLRVNCRRVCQTSACKSIAVHLLDFRAALNAGAVDGNERRILRIGRGNCRGVAGLHSDDEL